MGVDRLKITPAVKQYIENKQQYPDCILFFRMGDFYEMFFEDAKIVSRELNITLTSRGKDKVPLAGVPHHSVQPYLAKLVKKGYKVAIVEQLEDPRFAKGVVKRGVVRIVTPGTLIDDLMLNENVNNYLMAIANNDKCYGAAIVDISTGEFLVTEVNHIEKLKNEITRFNPAEILVPSFIANLFKGWHVNPYEERFFYKPIAYTKLKEFFEVANLEGFGIEKQELAISAAGALINYLEETQKTSLKQINNIKYFSTEDHMILDAATIRNLELIKSIIDNSTKNSLLGVLDKTLTPMGSRLLKQWLLRPLLDKKKINTRLSAVEELTANLLMKEELQDGLKQMYDIERLIGKIAYGNANARDLLALKKSLLVLPLIKKVLEESNSALLQEISKIKTQNKIVELIEKAIKEDPAATIKEGNIIKKNYNKDLDVLRELKTNSKKFIADLQKHEIKRTGIKSLKIKYNKVFGYFIEVTKPNLHLVPSNYIRKQTQVNSERFITEELKEHESKILNAEEKIVNLEYELFCNIINQINEHTKEIQKAAHEIAKLDVLVSFANVSLVNRYTKPELNSNNEINIKAGRHPVLEQTEQIYIPNDCLMDENLNMMIITGPNMAGKSSYMRQVALIQLMAQIGCFVPADYASLDIVDRIFTRVGAHDDLASGQSTFMVEMNETANILNNATKKSLVILDEIGRGTSTFDGVSIAWSVAEYINKEIKAKTLFATHYHVLNKLETKLKSVKNFNITVAEDGDKIVFLRKIMPGGTDKSYGVQVAKLAGLPADVIERAKQIQFQLEDENKMKDKVVVERTLVNKTRTLDKFAGTQTDQREYVYKKLKQKNLEDW